MQLFVIEAYKGRINTMTSKSAKETEKMFCVEWGGNSTYTTRLKKDKEYALNIIGDNFSMWGRDSVKLAKEFSSAMKEVLSEKETLVSHIKTYSSAEITFHAPYVKFDKKNKPKKKSTLNIVKHNKV